MASEDFPSPSLWQKHVRQLMKTEMCKFFLSNRCGKGSRCAFAHSLTEIREKPDLIKTSMCRSFLQTGNCDQPGCTFAHDERELRTTAGFFKTKMCRFAASGRCKHGNQCRFAHNADELSPEASRGNPYDGDDAGVSPPRLQSMGGPASTYGGVSDGHAPSSDQAYTEAWADITSDQSTREIASDQSTRAETSASVPTPEGSGDSGQEEPGRSGLGAPRRGLGGTGRVERRTGNERLPGRHCTTLMLTNVPNFLTQGALVSLLEDLTVCVRGAFDFFYCPWDPYQDLNLGYAIINFFSRSVAAEFEREWANQPLLPRTHGTKRLRIVPAALQGRAANLRHFSGFSLAHHADPRFRPLVRAAPNEALRPMAISEELVRNAQHPQPGGHGAGGCSAREGHAQAQPVQPPRHKAWAAGVEELRHAQQLQQHQLQQQQLHQFQQQQQQQEWAAGSREESLIQLQMLAAASGGGMGAMAFPQGGKRGNGAGGGAQGQRQMPSAVAAAALWNSGGMPGGPGRYVLVAQPSPAGNLQVQGDGGAADLLLEQLGKVRNAGMADDMAGMQSCWALVSLPPGAAPTDVCGGMGVGDRLSPGSAALGAMGALPCYTNGLSPAGLAYIPQLSSLPPQGSLMEDCQ